MYEQSFTSNVDEDAIGSALELPDKLRDLYPNLSLAIGGRAGSKKEKKAQIQPATVILFARDGGIGFVIAPKDAPRNAHGFIREPENVWEQIEQELSEGRIGWKVPSRKRS